MNFATLVPKRDDEVDASRNGKWVYPTIVTPFAVVITSSGTVCVAFPSLAAARLTMTLPAFMTSSISWVTITDALQPGMRAVAMTMLTSEACLSIRHDGRLEAVMS